MSAYTDALDAGTPPANTWVLGDTSGTTATARTGAITGLYDGSAIRTLNGAVARDTARCTGFDGSLSRVSFGDNFDFAGIVPVYTFEMMAQIHVDAPNTTMALIDKSQTNAGGRQGYDLIVSSRRLLLQHWLDNAQNNVFPNPTLERGVWYHIAASCDGSTMRLYVDGSQWGSNTGATLALLDNSAQFTAGFSNGLSLNPLRGKLQYLSRYTTALTGSEIWDHANAALEATNPSTYYVDTAGSDGNPGTSALPWRTLIRAANASGADAGDTVVFRSGTYVQASIRPNETWANSGTKRSPITFRSETPWGAVLSFTGFRDGEHIRSLTKTHIKFQDFHVTNGDGIGTNFGDVLVRWWYTDHSASGQVYESADFCECTGCRITNGYEPVKVSHAYRTVFRNNQVEGANVGYGSVNGVAPIIDNNYFLYNRTDAGTQQTGFQCKGGTRDAWIANNRVFVPSGADPLLSGFDGASTDTGGLYDTSASGREAYNLVFVNNVIHAEQSGGIGFAIILQGQLDPLVMNNTILGAGGGVGFRIQQGGPFLHDAGATLSPQTRNPRIVGNILFRTTYDRLFASGESSAGIDLEGSLYYEANLHCSVINVLSTMASGASGNPNFVDFTSDWRLGSGTAASGLALTASQPGLYSETTYTLGVDRAGRTRTVPWDAGAYEFVALTPLARMYGSRPLRLWRRRR